LLYYAGGAGTATSLYTPLNTDGVFSPYGVAVISPDNIYVADGDNGTDGGAVLQLTPTTSGTPTIQASNVTFSNITTTGATAQWTSGNGAARTVFISNSSTGSPLPVSGTTYTANAAFGSGDQIGTSGWYCVYNGTGTSVNITGLSAGSHYRVMTVEYNGTANYLTTAGTGNPANFNTISVADLNIANTDNESVYIPGGDLTYEIAVNNIGPNDVTGATVTNTFPAGSNWTAVFAGGATGNASGTGNINETVNIPLNGSIVYTAIAPIPSSQSGNLDNISTVTVPAGVTDPNLANNEAQDLDTPHPLAYLTITNTDGQSTYTAGSTHTYTVVVSDNGPSDVTGAIVGETLPAASTWTAVFAGGATGNASGTGNINETVNIPWNGTITYTVTVPIPGTQSGNFTTAATVVTPQGVTNSNTANNIAIDTDTPIILPVVTTTGGSTTYIGTPVAIDNGITVIDAGSATLASAAVSITSGFQPGDLLNFINQNGITGSFNAATGVLTLTGSTTLASYQAALESISFSTTSLNTAARTISFIVNDGTASSAAATKAVMVVLPVITFSPIGSKTYGTPDFAPGATSTVTFTPITYTSSNTAVATIVGGNIHIIGTGISNITASQGGGATGTATLPPDVTQTLIVTAAPLTITADNLNKDIGTTLTGGGGSTAFTSTGLNPSETIGSVSITYGTGAAAGATTGTYIGSVIPSAATGGTFNTSNYNITYAAGNITVIVPLPPVVTTTSGSTTYTGTAIVIDNGLTVTDAGSTTLTSATVSIIAGFQTSDFLNFTNQNGITGSFDSATGLLTLSGSATLSNYQAALQSVSFSTTSLNTAARTINFIVSDGTTNSTAASKTVIFPSPDATLLSLTTTAGTLSPVFSSGTSSYTASVANTVSGITVTPIANNTSAAITVNGAAVTSGTASGSIPLNVGANTLTTVVTAQDGINTLTYTVYVTRQPPNQTFADNVATTAVAFPDNGVIYNWTNSNTGIGLPASGTGNIASFTAANTGGSPIIATITATPASQAYIANTSSGTVSVINTATQVVIATITAGTNPIGVSVSPDGSKAYVTNQGSSTISVINTTTNTVIATIPVGAIPAGISVSPDGSRAYVTNYSSGSVSVINTANNTVISTITVGTNPYNISASPNGSKVYVTNLNSSTVSVINTANNTVISTIPVGASPYGVSVSPDGSKVYVASYISNTVSVINTATNTVVATISVSTPIGVSVSPDGSTLYVTNYIGGAVSVINTANNTVVTTIGVGDLPFGVSVSPDGTQAYVANYGSGYVSVINTATNTVTSFITVGTGPHSFGNFITGTGVQPLSFTVTVNPPPIVTTTGGSTTYAGTQVAVDNGVTVTDDNGSSSLASATVSISSGFQTGDQLNFINQNGITGSFNAATGVLTLSGVASLPSYQAALQSITYTGGASVTGTRTVSFTVNDGTSNSAPATKTISIAIPTVAISSITTTNASPTNAATVQYHVKFAASVTGLSISNLSLTTTGTITGANILSRVGSGSSYTVTVNTGTGDGNLTLNLANSTGISPEISNEPFTGDTYAIDKTAPVATSLIYASSNAISNFAKVGDVVSLNFGSNEAIQTPVVTIAGHTITAVSTGGNNYVASYTMTSGDVEGRIPFTLQMTDLAGNVSNFTDAAAGDDITFDQTPPTVTISNPSVSSTHTGPVSYTITYADANFNTSSLALSNITPITTGTATGTIGLSGSGTSYTVTISNTSGTGTLGISIAAGTASDIAGNIAGAAGPSVTFSVTPTPQTITFNALPTETYGNADFSPGASSDNNGIPITYSSDNTAVATIVSGNIHIVSAGTANITASQAGDATHSAATDVIQQLTVNQAPLTITASNKSKVYGAAMPTLTVSYNGFVNGDTKASLTTKPTLTTAATAASPVNIYPITPSGAVDNNYAITYVAGTLTIGQAQLTITADNQSSTYGQNIPTLTATYAGFVNGDNSLSLTTAPTLSTTATSASPVNTYLITPLGAVDNNYAITYVAGTLTIGQAPLTITADNQSSTYGQNIPTLTATYSGFVNGDNVSSLTTAASVSTTATAASPVNSYPIAASGAVDNNYAITYVTGTLTIGQAPLTITADNQSSTYGQNIPTLTATYSGFVNGDNVSSLTTAAFVSTTATAASPANSYPITASGAVDNNYAITYVAGTLTIGQAALTITADNQSSTYGQNIPILTATYSGFVNGDNASSLTTAATLSTTATSASPANTYPITASGAVDNNYAITYVGGTLTIGQAPLTITANNQSSTYGQNIPILTASYTGFVNGDSQSSLTTLPTLATTATASSPVNTYPITASGAVDNNYVISYVAGMLTIGHATLTITADNQSSTYGGTIPALTASYIGFVNGDTQASLTTQPTIATTATTGAAAGNYPITASGAVIPNYTIVYVQGTLSVAKALLTITADNKSRLYGVANPALTATYSGFVNGDSESSLTILPTLKVKASATTLPGNYPITPSGATAANYSFSYVKGTLTIIPLSNANLANLALSEGTLSPVFDSGIMSYTASVENATNTVNVIPTAADPTATIAVNGESVNSGSPSGKIDLHTGYNTITVVVTAQDGVTQNTFTITVYRGEAASSIVATNLLTPNGDGKNDYWIIKDIQLYPNNNVVVYDRAGRQVYNKHGYDNDWGGTVNGLPLAEGTYYYTVDLGQGLRKFYGYVTILRSH
jgi:gliding motility-associated-like protein